MVSDAPKQLFFRNLASILVNIYPVSDLVVPDEAVATELNTIGATEIGNAVGIFPAELVLAILCPGGLHVVLGRDAVEFTLYEGHLFRNLHIALVHGYAHHKILLQCVLQSLGYGIARWEHQQYGDNKEFRVLMIHSVLWG